MADAENVTVIEATPATTLTPLGGAGGEATVSVAGNGGLLRPIGVVTAPPASVMVAGVKPPFTVTE